ncbi:MAG: DUF1002 domain-containing protein [Bacillota bacterium]|nr:DUF1002 domain-containing protein [Bacillota bacterium]
MKLMNKVLGATLASVLAMSSLSANAFAIETEVIDEKWGKPTIVYGGGLNQEQINQTTNLFGVTDKNNVYEMYTYGQDLDKYLNFVGGNTASLISSVMVKKTGSNGVVVKILTPENITKITQQQYANAAITAGVYNCEIEVASVSRVTGESALTGVYKAFEANGEVLDTNRTAVAQEELETTNAIAQENANTQGFNSSTLDAAMTEIKKELAEAKQQYGSIDQQTVINVVNNVINNYNLGNILSQDNINAIINLMNKYVNTSAIDSKEVLNQLNNLANSLHIDVNGLIQDAKASGLWDKIVNFFVDIWNMLTK